METKTFELFDLLKTQKTSTLTKTRNDIIKEEILHILNEHDLFTVQDIHSQINNAISLQKLSIILKELAEDDQIRIFQRQGKTLFVKNY